MSGGNQAMNYLYLLLKFIIGGGIVLAVTLLVNYVTPRWGGMIAVAPIITTLSFIFVNYETNIDTTRQVVLASIRYIIPTLFFLILLYFLLNKLNLTLSLIISYLFWISIIIVQKKFLGG
jgi:uncharacterized membrane protein (GlpM family)